MNDDAKPLAVCVALDLDEAMQEREADLLHLFASDLVRTLLTMQSED